VMEGTWVLVLWFYFKIYVVMQQTTNMLTSSDRPSKK
jgi:hypothetical protein